MGVELVGNPDVLQAWRDVNALSDARRLSDVRDASATMARLLDLSTEKFREWLLDSCQHDYRCRRFQAGKPYRYVWRGWWRYRRYYEHPRYYYEYWSLVKAFVKQSNIDRAVLDNLILDCPATFECHFSYEE